MMNAEFGIKKLIRFAFRIPISAFLSSLMNKGLRQKARNKVLTALPTRRSEIVP